MSEGYFVEASGGNPVDVYRELVESGHLPGGKELRLLSFKADPRKQAEYVVESGALNGTIGIYILKMDSKVEVSYEKKLTGKCKANENIHKGQRKWVTYHVVYVDERIEEQDVYGNLITVKRQKEVDCFTTKGEAVDAAKKYAVDFECETYIHLEKRLDGSDRFIGSYMPVKEQVEERKSIPNNRYLFFAEAEETKGEEEDDLAI